MVSFDDLVRKHGRVKLYDDVCVEHIGFYAVESCACMGFIVYRDVEMIGAGSTVLEAMRSAGPRLRLEQPAAAAVPDCGCCKGDGSMCPKVCRHAEENPTAFGRPPESEAEAEALGLSNKENRRG